MRRAWNVSGVRLACQRITLEEIGRLHGPSRLEEAALQRQDLEAYRLYNQELHATIMQAARNAELAQVAAQASLKTQMLSAKTIRLVAGLLMPCESTARSSKLIAKRDAQAAQELMERHILSAMEDIFRHGLR